MLASDGHTVLTAASGREGLARLEAGESVDVVFTDLAMPEMSGWDVMHVVKRRWPDVRVGVITGTPQYLEDRRETIDVLILKPLTIQALREAMAQLRRITT